MTNLEEVRLSEIENELQASLIKYEGKNLSSNKKMEIIFYRNSFLPELFDLKLKKAYEDGFNDGLRQASKK